MSPNRSRGGRRARLLTGALAIVALLATLMALWQTQSGPLVGPAHPHRPPSRTPRPSALTRAPAPATPLPARPPRAPQSTPHPRPSATVRSAARSAPRPTVRTPPSAHEAVRIPP